MVAGDDPVLFALADAAARYPIPLAAFDDLVDGAELDVEPRPYETFDDLVRYCRCVAGSIGRLCLGVFETRDRERATVLADDLGVALQLTNILRDVGEDLDNGRVYLPQEDLRRFGCDLGVAGGTSAPSSSSSGSRPSGPRAGTSAGSGSCRSSTVGQRRRWGRWQGVYRRLLAADRARPGGRAVDAVSR